MKTPSTDTTLPIDDAERPEPVPGRRKFFAVGGAAAAAAFLAACGDDDDGGDAAPPSSEGDPPSDESTTTTSGAPVDEGAIIAFAAGLELLAANTYTAALDAATAGSLGEIPPAVAEYATVAQSQHQAASDALAEAGGITAEVPADIEAAVNEGFAGVTDVAGLATFARDFELQAAATYLDVIPKLESEAAIMLAGSIMPIARQRAAILTFALGEYPIPDVFATADMSLAPG